MDGIMQPYITNGDPLC